MSGSSSRRHGGWQGLTATAFISVLTACGSAAPPGANPGSGGSGNALGGAGASGASAGTGASTGGALSSGGTAAASGAAAAGGAAGRGDSDPDPTSKAAACVYYARHYCEKLAACSGSTPACEAIGDPCPDLLFSEGSTRTVEGLVACAKQLDAAPCATLAAGEEPACITGGTKQPGEACAFPSQCSTLSCSGDTRSCGVCQQNAALGDSCLGNLGCAGLTACDRLSNTCVAFVQVAAQLGEACPTGQCVLGAYCSASAGKICRPMPELGQPCPDSVCDSQNRLYCGTDNTCKAPPTANEPCATSSQQALVCSFESVCNESAAGGPTCVAQGTEGLPCQGATCRFGYYCDDFASGSDGTCRTALSKGGSCPGDIVCLHDLRCNNGKCSSYADPGQPCSDGSTVCRPGGQCDGTLCQPQDSQGLFRQVCLQ